TDVQSDILSPFWRYLAASAPIVFAIVLYGEERFDSAILGFLFVLIDPKGIFDYPLPALLLVVGLLLWPLLTVIAAMSRSALATLNPALWLSSLRVLRTDYLAGAAAFYAVFVLDIFVWTQLLLWIQAHLSVWGITSVVTTFLGYL